MSAFKTRHGYGGLVANCFDVKAGNKLEHGKVQITFIPKRKLHSKQNDSFRRTRVHNKVIMTLTLTLTLKVIPKTLTLTLTLLSGARAQERYRV